MFLDLVKYQAFFLLFLVPVLGTFLLLSALLVGYIK